MINKKHINRQSYNHSSASGLIVRDDVLQLVVGDQALDGRLLPAEWTLGVLFEAFVYGFLLEGVTALRDSHWLLHYF